jgi:hypothetical protein
VLRALDIRGAPSAIHWTQPALIVTVALLLRLAWAAVVPAVPVSDGVVYDAFARSLAAGHGYAFPDGTRTAYWPVGTSAVYALLYRLCGGGVGVIAGFQSLLGAAIVALTWRLARYTFGRTAAGVSAWLVAVWPLLIEFTTVFASELLFIAVVLAALNVWISLRVPWVYRMALWGACVAAATYVRPTALPLLVALPAVQCLVERDWRPLRAVVPAALAATILFVPWVGRNFALFDSFVLVSANGGVNLWMGNNPDSTGGYMELPTRQFANEAERDRYFGSVALQYIRGHPGEYAKLTAHRTRITYDRETIGVDWNAAGLGSRYQAVAPVLKAVSSAYWWTLLLLGATGFVLATGRPQVFAAWPLLIACAYFALFPILTVGMDRYHVPVDPMLAILAGYLLTRRVRHANVQLSSGLSG